MDNGSVRFAAALSQRRARAQNGLAPKSLKGVNDYERLHREPALAW
jgi:hypothetical protein